MELTGKLGSDDRKIYEKFLVPLTDKLKNELLNLPQSPAKNVLLEIHNDLAAIAGSVMTLCKLSTASSQATASLIRTLLEGCLSAFAFCINPTKQSDLYTNFRAVLDYRFACNEEKHLGCPFLKDTPEKRQAIEWKKENARKILETVGLEYLKGKPNNEKLQAALSTGNHKAFRDKWYPYERRALLREEGMEWLYDVVYVKLCSAVHSDSAASKVFAGLKKHIVFTLTWQLYSAVVYRLVEAFHINLSAEHKGIVRKSYTALQHKPSYGSNLMKRIHLLYGRDGMELSVPDSADVLTGQHVPAVADAAAAVEAALARPIGSASLAEMVAAKRPRTVAITISDITRPVPNKQFLPAMLKALNACGVADSQIVIIIGTGMHRPSTPAETETLVGKEILGRVEVIDHRADDPSTLVRVSDDPPVSVCKRFAQADLRIVTGYIEAHFMAGFSGGRKGVCPALVDLQTVQRFHGYQTLSNPSADTGVLEGNPCHEIALAVARKVGVDMLFNVAITGDRKIAGIYCGDLEQAHEAGCKQVAKWTTAEIDGPYDLVITNGGGYPLDQTFYQTVKGMCTALPALAAGSTMLQVSHCGEQLGSRTFTELMMKWDGDWRGFLAHIEANKDRTELDQWEFQMQARVLAVIGPEKLLFASDGIPARLQMHIGVNPLLGPGIAAERAQKAIDAYAAEHPAARIAVIPDGPYTMLRARGR